LLIYRGGISKGADWGKKIFLKIKNLFSFWPGSIYSESPDSKEEIFFKLYSIFMRFIGLKFFPKNKI
jgi:hypothetical protein